MPAISWWKMKTLHMGENWEWSRDIEWLSFENSILIVFFFDVGSHHPLRRNCLYFWGVCRALQSQVVWKNILDRGKVVLTTLSIRPNQSGYCRSPGDELWPAQFHSSPAHFSFTHVKDLGRNTFWSQRSQGRVLWSLLEEGWSTLGWS